MDITQYLRETIQEEYGSYRRFARIIGMPNSTLVASLNKENGFGKMPVDSAIKICKELDLDINEIFNYKVEPLTVDEKRLVDNYKQLSDHGKTFISDILDSLIDYESSQEEPTLIAASGAENLSDEEMKALKEDIEMVKNLK